MSLPRTNLDWFGYDGNPIGAPAEAGIVEQAKASATACFSLIEPQRQVVCLRAALSLACRGADLFRPRLAGPADLRWFTSDGKPAPAVGFPVDFIDRRKVLAWSLYRLTLSRLRDDPIFSAQARVTSHDDSFFSFTNYAKPGASILTDKNVLPLEENAGNSATERPTVRILMQQANGFEDVIFYTALFNFGRALCAFQTGPWAALRAAMADQRSVLDMLAASPAEARAIGRGALAALDAAWNASHSRAVAEMSATMLGVLTAALGATNQ